MFVPGLIVRHKIWGLLAKILNIKEDKFECQLLYPLEVVGGFLDKIIFTKDDLELPIFKCKHGKENL
jgi:hypothetical protein